ncbi:response regulator transcription factor [Alteromonas gracilis]
MISLLLCDGHRFFLDALALSLPSGPGEEIAARGCAPDAVAVLVSQQRPDVCLMDLVFDGVERPDLPVLIKELSPDTAVLLLTASRAPSRWTLLDDGVVDGLLDKSCSLEQVRRAVAEAARGGRPVVGCARPRIPQQRPSLGERLTGKEREVLAALVDGCSTTQLQERLGVSRNTVRTHVQHVLDKLQVGTRAQAVQVALREQRADPVGSGASRG